MPSTIDSFTLELVLRTKLAAGFNEIAHFLSISQTIAARAALYIGAQGVAVSGAWHPGTPLRPGE
jgi:hypothetical protein